MFDSFIMSEISLVTAQFISFYQNVIYQHHFYIACFKERVLSFECDIYFLLLLLWLNVIHIFFSFFGNVFLSIVYIHCNGRKLEIVWSNSKQRSLSIVTNKWNYGNYIMRKKRECDTIVKRSKLTTHDHLVTVVYLHWNDIE